MAFTAVLSHVADRSDAQSRLDGGESWRRTVSLIHRAAIVDTDNRQVRTLENTQAFKLIDLEGLQGRIWCRMNGLDTPQKKPTKIALRGYYTVANAGIVFENDIILVNRHNFVNEDGTVKFRSSGCYYEEVGTGQLIKLTSKVVFPNYVPDGRHISYLNGDFALVRLEEKVPSSTPLELAGMIINSSRRGQIALTIIANAADNNKNGESLLQTIAICKAITSLNISRTKTRLVGTNCATGLGSSGAQVYAMDPSGNPKFFGVVVGEIKDNVEGSGYVPLKLSTIIETFDDSLPALYAKLKALD
jgi:hypothetical protein